MSGRTMLIALALSCLVQTAAAENRSVSHSQWTITENRVALRLVLPIAETRQLSGPALPPPSSDKVANYVLDHVAVAAGDSPCPSIDQGYDIGQINTLSMAPGLYGFEVIFQCPNAEKLVLRNSVLMDRVPQHIDFARVEKNGSVAAQLFRSGREQLLIPVSGPAAAAPSEYLRLGSSHILRSVERIGFLAGLLLLARVRRERVAVAGSLSFGYLASACLSAGGYAIPNVPAVEATLGFLVALLAAQAIGLHMKRPRILAGMLGAALILISLATLLLRGVRLASLPLGLGIFAACFVHVAIGRRALPVLVLPALFSFLDGLVLPGDFAKLELWGPLPFPQLIAFNTGAWLTDLVVLALFMCVAALWHQRTVALSRIAQELGVTALAGLGTFWMLSALWLV